MHELRSRIAILFSQTTEIMIACFGLANCQILQYLRIYHFTSHRSINQLALDKKMFGKHSFPNHRLVWQSKCSYQWDSLTIDWGESVLTMSEALSKYHVGQNLGKCQNYNREILAYDWANVWQFVTVLAAQGGAIRTIFARHIYW